MRKFILSILFLLFVALLNSQNIFNKLIYDTISHVNPSIVTLDTGYVVLSGTGTTGHSPGDLRCFALSYVDLSGERRWQKKYTDYQNEYWEGWSNSFKKNGNISYSTGRIFDIFTYNSYIYIYIYDSLFDIKHHNTMLNDTITKRSFNVINSSTNNFYITGEIDDNGQSRLLLIKTDSLGNYIWNKSIGDIYTHGYGGQVLETTDKNILMGGDCFIESSVKQYWYLVKADTAGNIIWQNTYGSNRLYNDGIRGLVETHDSCYIACGGYPAAGLSADVSNYFWDGCLRKINMNGGLIWEKRYRSYSYYPPTTADGEITPEMKMHLNSVIVLEDGDIMVVGSSYRHTTRNRGVLMRLDPEGNIKWHRYYYAESEETTSQWLRVLQPTPDKGFILGGDGDMYDQWPGGYDPPQQLWLVKTDSLGIDGLCYNEAPGLNFNIDIPDTLPCNRTINAYAYISGKSAPYKIGTTTGQVIDSIFYPFRFVPMEIGLGPVYVEHGIYIQFRDTITEATFTNHEWGECIVKPVAINTPSSTGYHNFGITVSDAYGESKTISKLVYVEGDCSSSADTDELPGVFKVYPNPAVDILYVEPGNKINCNCGSCILNIYDPDSKLLRTINIEKGEMSKAINLQGFAPGIYLAELTGCNGKKYSVRFTKY